VDLRCQSSAVAVAEHISLGEGSRLQVVFRRPLTRGAAEDRCPRLDVHTPTASASARDSSWS